MKGGWPAKHLVALGGALCLMTCGGSTDGPLRPVLPEDIPSKLSEEPGSYEWFNFYAESEDGQASLSAIFFSANLFDCSYRKAVRDWQADPEGAPRPRLADHWLLQLNLSINGTKVFTNLRRWPDTAVDFPRDAPRGRVGDSSFEWTPSPEGGTFRVHLDAPDMTHDSRLKGEMVLESAAPGFAVADGGMYRSFPNGLNHEWQLPVGLPRTRVTFRVERRDGTVVIPEQSFSGSGYVDHMWGRGLLGDLLTSWDFGTTPLPDGGRLIHVWLTPADRSVPPSGWVFRVRPGRMAKPWPIVAAHPSDPRTGQMGLPFPGDLRLDLEGGGHVRVRLGSVLGEDWPFQVSGPSVVDVQLPGDLSEEGLRGVAERLVQQAIDDEEYCNAAAVIDRLPWNP